MISSRYYLPYVFKGSYQNRAVSSVEAPNGTFPYLSGIDGRFMGGLKNFYGMSEVVDLDDVSGTGDIDTYDGPSFIKHVVFKKIGSSSIYRGFVIRWDKANDNSNEQVDFVYTLDNGGTWAAKEIWAQSGNGITSSLEMDCAVDSRGYLFVYIYGKATKTVYYDTGAASLTVVSSGPGAFSSTLGAVTLSTTAVDTSYYLEGDGIYQVAWRFYSSTRGIYSALSDPLIVYLDHYKTTKATGTITFNSGGGDSGLFIDGDVITINGRDYEADNNSSISGDVTVDITGVTTIAGCISALVDAINGDSSAVVTARAQATSVLLEATTRGSTGNAYDLSVTETGGNTDDISVSAATLTGGGTATTDPETQCKATLDFPANTAVIAGQAYANFAALFDTVQVFRTISTKTFVQNGGIFYLEQSIAKTGNWATSGTWDSLQVTIGTVLDEALPAYTQYDPETDIVDTPPTSGTAGRYQGLTYAGASHDATDPYAILHSSPEHTSGEYFTTFNKRDGDSELGRPLRCVKAGDAMFVLQTNSVVHVYKSGTGTAIQYTNHHQGRGLSSKYVAHGVGNIIVMTTGTCAVMLNSTDASMAQFSALDRLFSKDWKDELTSLWGCFDAELNASFILDSTRKQLAVIWHSTQTSGMLDGANFVACTSGPQISNGGKERAFFITAKGLIVMPDFAESGSGTMWGLSDSYTLNGAVDSASDGTTVVDSDATFHADMVGALVYMVTGSNAGVSREVSSVDTGTGTLTLTSGFDNPIALNDRYVVSPVPVKIRCWPMRDPDPEVTENRFNRWVMTSIALKAVGVTIGAVNNEWRVGGYVNGSTTLSTTTDYITVSSTPSDCVGTVNIAGTDVEPYIELLSAGAKVELTRAEVGGTMSASRQTESS